MALAHRPWDRKRTFLSVFATACGWVAVHVAAVADVVIVNQLPFDQQDGMTSMEHTTQSSLRLRAADDVRLPPSPTGSWDIKRVVGAMLTLDANIPPDTMFAEIYADAGGKPAPTPFWSGNASSVVSQGVHSPTGAKIWEVTVDTVAGGLAGEVLWISLGIRTSGADTLGFFGTRNYNMPVNGSMAHLRDSAGVWRPVTQAIGGPQTDLAFRLEGVQGPCTADFDFSGVVTVQDLFTYLVLWFERAPRADLNHTGTVTVQDLFTFLTLWFLRCPLP